MCQKIQVDYGSSIDRWDFLQVRRFKLRVLWNEEYKIFSMCPATDSIDEISSYQRPFDIARQLEL